MGWLLVPHLWCSVTLLMRSQRSRAGLSCFVPSGTPEGDRRRPRSVAARMDAKGKSGGDKLRPYSGRMRRQNGVYSAALPPKSRLRRASRAGRVPRLVGRCATAGVGRSKLRPYSGRMRRQNGVYSAALLPTSRLRRASRPGRVRRAKRRGDSDVLDTDRIEKPKSWRP